MGVPVAHPRAETPGAAVMGVPQVVRHLDAQPLPYVGHGPVDGADGRIALRGRGDVGRGLGERDPGLGHPHLAGRLGGRRGQHQGPGIGVAHVLRRADDHAPGQVERILSRLEHPGHPVQGRVRVSAAEALDEGGDEIVMIVPPVARGRPLEDLAHDGGGDRHPAPFRPRGQDGEFQGVQGLARIPVGKPRDPSQRTGFDLHPKLPEPPLPVRQGPPEQLDEVRLLEPSEREDHRTRGQGRHQGEEGVLRRGADQGDRPLLHLGQQPVLLRLVETVDLVDEQDRLAAGQGRGFRRRDRLPDLGQARGHGVQAQELRGRPFRDDTGQGRLSRARRTVEHEGDEGVFLDGPPERPPRRKQMRLSDELVQASRLHAPGERFLPCRSEKRHLPPYRRAPARGRGAGPFHARRRRSPDAILKTTGSGIGRPGSPARGDRSLRLGGTSGDAPQERVGCAAGRLRPAGPADRTRTAGTAAFHLRPASIFNVSLDRKFLNSGAPLFPAAPALRGSRHGKGPALPCGR